MVEQGAALSDTQRRLALGGVVGVGGFVAAWALCGLARDGYSPVSDAISRLAEIGSPTRVPMTAGFIAFGIGVPMYAGALRHALAGPAWITAAATGVATLGVAAIPLGWADTAHGVFATVGYVTLALTPLLAAREFRTLGRSRWARWSIACGVGSALALVATVPGPAHGLAQRAGLLITDAWIVATAWTMWRRGRLP